MIASSLISFIYLSIKHVVLIFIKESLYNFTETREMWQHIGEKFLLLHQGLPWLLSGKESAFQCKTQVPSLIPHAVE